MIDVEHYEEMVKGPGKFEGEPPETAYFYEQWENGDGESYWPSFETDETDDEDTESGPEATLFKIDADEAEAFDLNIGDWFILWEDSQGYVYSRVEETRKAAEETFDKWLGIKP